MAGGSQAGSFTRVRATGLLLTSRLSTSMGRWKLPTAETPCSLNITLRTAMRREEVIKGTAIPQTRACISHIGMYWRQLKGISVRHVQKVCGGTCIAWDNQSLRPKTRGMSKI